MIVGVPLMNLRLLANLRVMMLKATVIVPNTGMEIVGFHHGLSSVVASSAAIEPIVMPVM